MGCAIAGMHYTGMPVATVLTSEEHLTIGALDNVWLVAAVVLVTSIILGLLLVAAWVDRRFAEWNVDLTVTEQRFRSLFEHHPDAVYSLVRDGRFESVNPAAERITGYTVAEFIHRPSLRLVAHDDVERSRHHFVEALRGHPQHYEAAIIHKLGHEIHVQMTLVPMIVTGKVVGIFGIGKDVTERKQAAQLMHQALHDS